MPLNNSRTRYGAVAKTFHWLTALLILTVIPLGLVANEIAHAIKDPDIATTEADISRTALLFSLHKTIGIAIFFVALARIAWALGQPKPGLLNGDKRFEALAAETVHWLLYGSLVLVPLSGWIHHAATTGFAPIWWPFGQSLPFVPKSEAVAEIFGETHVILSWTLGGALLLHIAGALKHHVIDRDATLRRMLPGRTEAEPAPVQPGHAGALVSAVLVWATVLGGGAALGFYAPLGHATGTDTTEAHADAASSAAPEAPEGTELTEPAEVAANDWVVTDGTLGLTLQQMGTDMSGVFDDWSAAISYENTADAEGLHGRVDVTVTIASLRLGSVTDQALGSDYFDAATHPKAQFTADIVRDGDTHVAQGTLTIRGNAMPVELPFTLTLDGDTATASGEVRVDRRDFGIGAQETANVGADVTIRFELTAMRASAAPDAGASSAIAGDTNWRVDEGRLGIAVTQMGSGIEGDFADWTARIAFSETPDADGRNGSVRVETRIGSLTLGSVTSQALGADYFDAATYPDATFDAVITQTDVGFLAEGELTIKGVTLPFTLPFDLDIEGDQATASGEVRIDRRDFGIGAQETGNVGADVVVRFDLIATRTNGS